MKRMLLLGLSAILIYNIIIAQEKSNLMEVKKYVSLTGYLVDKMCAKRMVMNDIKKSDAKAASHTKECALEETCSAAGYGLVTEGKFYKFDSAGDEKAKEYLNSIQKEDNIKVIITGIMVGDGITIKSIKNFKDVTSKASKRR